MFGVKVRFYLGLRVYPGFIQNPPLILFWIQRMV